MPRNKKHYTERHHSRTAPKGPASTPSRMSSKKFKEWALIQRALLGPNKVPDNYPKGYNRRKYLRAVGQTVLDEQNVEINQNNKPFRQYKTEADR